MNSIVENIEQIAAAAASVAETKLELFKLRLASKVSASLSIIAIIFIITLFGSIALIILSFGFAYFIGSKLGSVSYGFFIIGGVFALAGFVFYSKRKAWVQGPIMNLLIDKLTK